MSTQSTKANLEHLSTSFGDLGLFRTQTDLGERTERSDIQKLPVPTQPVATELINSSHLEGSKTAGLTTEGTLTPDGKSFQICSE